MRNNPHFKSVRLRMPSGRWRIHLWPAFLVLDERWEFWLLGIISCLYRTKKMPLFPNLKVFSKSVYWDTEDRTRTDANSSWNVPLLTILFVVHGMTIDTARSVSSRVSTLTLWAVTKGIGPHPPVLVSWNLGLTACTHLTALLWKSNPLLTHIRVLSCNISFIYKIDIQNLLQVDDAYVQRDHIIILLRSRYHDQQERKMGFPPANLNWKLR
jgi:hypothetical protein